MTRLRRLETPSTGTPAAQAGFGIQGVIAYWHARRWFALLVVLPTLLASLYYGLIAADIYVSEARFVVRNTSAQPNATFLGNVLQTVGVGATQDEGFSVQNYILSRDIVGRLAENESLRDILSRPEGDFLRRYPPIWGRDSFEHLYKSYLAFVSVVYDSSTGVTTLTVEAFRPDDSYRLASAILGYSEELVNQINDRAQTDSLTVARQEVALGESRVVSAQEAMTDYRLRTSMLNPETTATAVLELVGTLTGELATAQTLLQETLRASPASPQIEPLRNRIAALQTQITIERRKVIGNDDAMALQVSEYERLVLEQEFATRALASATASLEVARLEAQRKQLYLEAIVTPNNPDYPILPQRLRMIAAIAMTALLIYGIAWLVSASVREHTAL